MSDDTKSLILRWGPLSLMLASVLVTFGLLIGQLKTLSTETDLKLAAVSDKLSALQIKHDHEHLDLTSRMAIFENRQSEVRISIAKMEALLASNHKMLSEIGRRVLEE